MYPEQPSNTPSFGGLPTFEQMNQIQVEKVAPNVIIDDQPTKEEFSAVKGLNTGQTPAGDVPFSGSNLLPEEFNFPLKVGDNERLRARMQSSWDQFGNWAMQSLLGEVLGQTISGVGALYELPVAIGTEIAGGDADFDNSLIELGKELREYGKKEFPIYRLNPNESWDTGDFAWWAENGVSMSSSLGLLLPALGFTKLTGFLASKVGSTLSATGKTVTSAAFMRNAENFQEATDVVKNVKDKTLTLFNSMTDEEFTNYKAETLSNLPETENKTREELANYIASKAGWKNYANNSANFVFDIIQTASLYKALKTTGRAGATAATAEAEAALVGKTLKSSTKTWLKAKPTLTFVAEQGTEGIEEYINFVSQQEGNEYGQALATGKDSDDFVTALTKYADDPEAWEQAFWGFMGGMAFGGGAAGIAKAHEIVNKYNNPYSDQQRTLEINNRVNKLSILGQQLDQINKGIDPATRKQFEGEPSDIQAFKDKATDELINHTLYDMSLSANRHGNREGFENYIKSKAFTDVLEKTGADPAKAKDLQNQAYDFTLEMNKAYDMYFSNLNKVKDGVRNILAGEIQRNTFWSKNLKNNLKRIAKRQSDIRSQDPGFVSDSYNKNAQIIDNSIRKNALVIAIEELKDFQKKHSNDVLGRVAKAKTDSVLAEFQQELDTLKATETELKTNGQSLDFVPISANELAQLQAAELMHNYKINELNDVNTSIVTKQQEVSVEVEDQLAKAQQVYNDNAFNAYKNYIDNATTAEELDQFNTKFQANQFNVDKFEQNKLSKETRKRIKDYLNVKLQAQRIRQTKTNNQTPQNQPIATNQFDEIINYINSYFSTSTLKNLTLNATNRPDLEASLSDFTEDLQNIEEDLSLGLVAAELIPNATAAKMLLTTTINTIKQKLGVTETITNQTTTQPFTPTVNSEVLDAFNSTLHEVFDLINAVRNQSAIDFEKYFSIRAKFLQQATEILGINEGDEFSFEDLASLIYHQLHSEQNPVFSSAMFAMVFGQVKSFYEFGLTMTNDNGKPLYKAPASQNLDEINYQRIINNYVQFKQEEVPFVSSDMGEVNFYLSSLSKDLVNAEGIIEVPAELEEVYNALLNEIKTGDGVQILIDQEYSEKGYSFNEHKNNPNFVPIKVVWKGKTIGHINVLEKDKFGNLAHVSAGFYYGGRGNDVIDYLMKPEVKKGLENLWIDIQNYLNGNIDKVIQQEAVEEFLNTIINQNNQNELDIKDFVDNNVKRALDHIQKVIFFGRTGNSVTEFDSERYDKVMASWKAKISRDVVGIEQIRNSIAGNTNAVVSRTIGKKSIGSVIYSRDEEGNPIYNNVTDVIDRSNLILVHGQKVGEEGSQVKVLSGKMTDDVVLSSNSTTPLIGLYALIPSANIDANGKRIHIPVRLHQNLVGGIEQDPNHTELLSYLTKEFTDLIDSARNNTADVKAFKNRLRPYVLVNDGALWVNQEGRPYIRFTSYNENGVKQEVYINVYEKSASIRIGSDEPINNHPENGDPALFEVALERAVANMRRNVALAFNTDNTNETRYFYSGTFTAFNNKTYNSYEDYLLESGAIVTDLGALVNEKGEHISHISPVGNSPLIINLAEETTNVVTTPTMMEAGVVKFAKANQLASDYDFVYEIADKLGIKIDEKLLSVNGAFIAQYKDNVVTLTDTWASLPNLEKSKQLVHEIIHGMIANAISKPEYALFVNRLKSFYETIKDKKSQDPTVQAIYNVIETGIASGNEKIYEELITYAFTNSAFAAHLSSITTGEVVDNTTKTAFDKLKEIILEIAQVIAKELGVTKLDELNSIINEFLTPDNNAGNSNNAGGLNLNGLNEESEEEGTGFNGEIKLSQVTDILGLFERDQYKEYQRAYQFWDRNKTLVTDTKREADGLYDRLQKQYGNIFYPPVQKKGKYFINVKKPIYESYVSARRKMWSELSDEDKQSYIALYEQEGYSQYSQVIDPSVDYTLKSIQLLNSNQGIIAFQKKDKFNWSLEKTLIELQIPKQQKELILSSDKTTREEIITDLLANYSYTIEINTAKTIATNSELADEKEYFNFNGFTYQISDGKFKKNSEVITEEQYNIAYNTALENKPNTSYYSNLTVNEDFYKNNPDWEYKEQRITTPLITPSIKGHAQFAENNDIGWFRAWYNKKTGEVHVLEVQSDLFQKGRDKNNLTNKEASPEDWIIEEDFGFFNVTDSKTGQPIDSFDTREKAQILIDKYRNKPENQFLQLLNKDNNWVTFFIKSIIQDSAKKGYEKVLFPTGNTASKVEGHTTLEEFKKQKEDRIKELENKKQEEQNEFGLEGWRYKSDDGLYKEHNRYGRENLTREVFNNALNQKQEKINNEIKQLKQELERVEREGFGALKPIYNFYENVVGNILKKQGYKPVLITDEYGNTWNEVTINAERDLTPILLSQVVDPNALSATVTPGFTVAEENHAVRDVITALFFQIKDQVAEITIGDVLKNEGNKLRVDIYEALRTHTLERAQNGQATQDEVDAVVKIVQELRKSDSMLWKKARIYLNLNYDIDIEDIDTLRKEGFLELNHNWDDRKQFSEDPNTTVNKEIKKLLALTPQADPTNTTINENRELVFVSNRKTFTGIQKLLIFAEVENYLRENLQDSSSKEEMLDRLYELGNIHDKSLLHIWQTIRNDENLLNGFYSSFKTFSPKTSAVFIKGFGDGLQIRTDVSNKEAFNTYSLANSWIDTLRIALLDPDNYGEEFQTAYKDTVNKLKELLKVYNQDNAKEITDLLIKAFDLFGISLRANEIDYHIRTEQHKYTAGLTRGVNSPAVNVINEFFLNKLYYLKQYIAYGDPKKDFSEASRMLDLAGITKKFRYTNTTATYSNISRNKVYNHVRPNELSNFFDKQKDGRLVEVLMNHAKVGKMAFSNWLWNTSKDVNNPNGFLDFDVKEGQRVNVRVNNKFYSQFDFARFDGQTNLSTGNAQEYTEIRENLTKMFKFLLPVVNKGAGLTFYEMFNADSGHTYDITGVKIDVDNGNVAKGTQIFNAIKNVIQQEISDVVDATNFVFQVRVTPNGLELVRDENNRPIVNEANSKYFVGDLHYNYKTNSVYTKSNNPAGSLFKLNVRNAKGETFDDFIKRKSNGRNSFFDELGYHNLDMGSDVLAYLDEFTAEVIDHIVNTDLEYNENNRGFLENAVDSFGTKLLDKYGSYENFMKEYSLNSYINTVEIRNFFGASNNELSSTIEYGKRANELTRGGIIGASKGTYKAITIAPVKMEGTVYQSLLDNQTRQQIDNSTVKAYKSFDIADGFSAITLEEFERRMTSQGRYNEFKDIIADLRNPNTPLNVEALTKIQQQKNFYYHYIFDPKLNRFVSKQVKNSEIILVPKAVKNVELGALYRWMNKNGIGQVDFTSAVKRGARKVVSLHNESTGKMLLDDKGNITSEISRQLLDAADIQYYEHLRTQQIIPDHLIDETNKLGVQISKVIFNNINADEIYTVSGKRYTGKELRQHYFNLLTNNIKESGIEVLAKFGVKLNNYGDLSGLTNADVKKIASILLEETINRQGNIGDIYANTYNEEANDTNLPIYWGVGLDKNISLLTSIWTNNVTIQQLPGIHATMTAGVFQSALRFKKSAIDYASPTAINGVNYLQEIHDRNDYRLKANLLENGRVLEAEVLLPAWSKRFFTAEEEVIDINLINEKAPELLQLMGHRIPFEGKHSAIVFKVVGFLPQSLGSRVVLPDDFVIKSGADFDIDSLYVFTKSFNRETIYPSRDYSSQEFLDFVEEQLAENNFKFQKGKKVVQRQFNADAVRNLAKEDVEWLNQVNQARYSIDEGTETVKYNGQEFTVDVKYQTLYDLVGNSDYKDVSILKTIMTRYNNAVRNQKPDYNFSVLTTEISDQQYYDKVMEIYNTPIGKELVREADLTNKVVLASAETDSRLQENDQISILDLANLFVKKGLIPTKEEFNSFDSYAKLTRAQRNNEIVDIFRSILLNRNHYAEQHKPVSTNTSDIDKAISQLHTISGESKEILDPNIAAHNDIIKQRNLTVRGLKGISVAMDGFFSIAQTMQSYISKGEDEDFAPYVSYKIEKNQLAKYQEIYGDDVISFDEKTSTITIAHRDIYRRKDGSFLNFDDNRITDISLQATAAILDAVKKPLPNNVNDYTIGVWKLFAALGVGHGWNYSTIFVNQPIVKEVTNSYYRNKSSYSTGNETYNLTEVKALYTYKLFETIDNYYKLEGKRFAPRVKDWANYKYTALEKQVEEGAIYLTADEFVEIFNFDYNEKKGFTLEQLENMITYENKVLGNARTQEEFKKQIQYLQNQLVILQQFSQLKRVSEEVTTLTNTYNTDKSGAGPSLETTIERETNLSLDGNVERTNHIRLRGVQHEMLTETAFQLHPSLQAWRTWSNLVSYAVLSPYDIRTGEPYQRFIQSVPNSDKVKSKAFQFFIGKVMEQLPFFNKVDSSILLGIDSDLFNVKLNTLVPSNISKFRKLSLANQILLLKNQRTDYLDSHNHNSLLNYCTLRISPRDIENNGYQKVDFTFDGRDLNPLIEETHQWYFGGDPYLKEVAKNLIRYAYFTNGYTFTYGSFAKVMHPEILARKVSEGGIGFSDFLRKQYNTMNDPLMASAVFGEDFVTRFLQNNWDNTRLVPLVVKRYTKEGKINSYKPTYSIQKTTLDGKEFNYLRISREVYERDGDYNEYPLLRVKTLSDKPKIMSMNFQGQFEQIVEGNKTQTTRISDQEFKVGDVVNVWNGGELVDGGVSYKYDRYKKKWMEYSDEQGWKAVSSANAERLNDKYGDPNLYISVEITGVQDAPAGELYEKVSNLRIDDDYFTKEGKPGNEGRASVLRNLKYFTSEKNKGKNAQIITFKKHGNLRTSPVSTVESDRIFKRYYPAIDGISSEYVYFYPVNKLMGNEYTETSRIGTNNEPISEVEYMNFIEKDYDEMIKLTKKSGEVDSNTDNSEALKSEVVDPFVSRSIADAEKLQNAVDFVLSNMARFKIRARILNKDGNIKDVNEQLDKIFIDELKEAKKEEILLGLKSILQYYQTTIGQLYTRLNYYDNDAAYNEMIKNKSDKVRFLKILRYAHLFIQGFQGINSLETLKNNESQDLDEVILNLKNWEKAVSSVNSLYGRLTKRYFEDDLTQYSSNPEIVSELRKLFDPQRDMNWAERWLDSVGDTENTFVALLYKKYVIAMYKAQQESKQERKAFEKVWNSFVNGRPMEEAIKDFINRYIHKDSEGNPTGRLIPKYNFDKFFEAKREMRERMNKAKTKGAKLAVYKDWYGVHEILSLTNDEGLTPEELIEVKKAELSDTEFRKWKKATFKLDRKTGKLFFKGSPNEKIYGNPEYEKVKNDPLYQYLVNNLPRFMSYFEGKGLGKGYLPVLPQHEGMSWLDKVVQKSGYFARKNSTFLGEDNEVIHYLDMPMLKALSLTKPFKIPVQKSGETTQNYHARVIRMAREAGFGEFKTFEEIQAKNDEIRKGNTKIHGTGISYNLGEIMNTFIDEIVKYKYKRELESELIIAKNFIKEEMQILKRDAKGKSIMDQTLSSLTGKPEYAVASARGSNVDKRFEDFLRMVFYEEFELDEGKLTKIARVLQNYTSAKNMWWNLTGAINNVAMGQSQLFMERAAGYFWNGDDGNAAEVSFWRGLPSILSSLNSQDTKNYEAAIMKYFDITAYQDEKNFGDDVEKSILHKHLLSSDAFYILHHIGEYYMQNKGLLAMLHSHRVVDGKIKSFVEYSNGLREEALRKIIGDQKYVEFVNYRQNVFQANKFEPDNSQRDYIRDYVLDALKKGKMTKAEVSNFTAEEKELKKQAKQEFEKYEKLFNSFEFTEDGSLKLKPNLVSAEEEALFVNKVTHVNQKIHGIYNTVDAGAIQKYALGRLAVQFRKWMRPGWNKRWGTKFGSQFWNEQRNEVDKGSYISFWQFMTKPITDNIGGDINEEHRITLKAVQNILRDYANFLGNVKLYYNTLNEFEKANIKRALSEMLTFGAVLAVGWVLGNMKEEDDDEVYVLNMMLYMQDRMVQELLFYNPYGWMNQAKQILRSPAAGWGTIEDMLKFMIFAFAYPFQDEEDRMYDRGPYKDELKVEATLKKLLPIIRQTQKMGRFDSYSEYYKLFSPL